MDAIFGMARVKLARVPKKSSANFVSTTPFLPYRKYPARVSSLVDIGSSIIIKNLRVILVENQQPFWKIHKKTASLYEWRLKFGPLKCLHYLFYANRAYFFSTRTIFTRARTTSPKVPARVRILVRHGWNLVLTGCLHCKFYPSRTFFFWDPCQFHPSRAKNFL